MASGGVVSFIAKVGGPNTNYSLSASSYTDDPMRFGGPSFTATPSGSTLTGGSANPSPDTPLVTTSSYDVFDNLLLVVQGVQNRSYTYDSLGRLTRVVTPEGGQVDYTYNSFDLVVTRDDPRDVTTTYQYDGLNRVIGVGYSIGQGSTSTSMPNNCTPSGGSAAHVCFVYGSTAASYNNGRLIQMIDGVGGEEYTYDALGRVTKVDKEIDSTTYSIEYAYNRVGAITSVEYPSGRTVAHSFDAIGRLTQVASGGTNHVSNVTYNAAHAPTAYDYGNGVAASIGYNSRFQLASLAYAKSGTKLLELAYGYTGHSNGGNNGQITGITDSTGTQEAGRSVSYTYDAWARLKTATTNGSTTYPAWGLSWTYDRYGNRTEQIQTAGSPPAHDPAVDSETNQFTDSGYDYDDAGNMTADGLNTLAYDGENRVATSTTNSVTTTSTYDGNSLRVKKQVGSGTATIYIFSGSKVIAEYAAGAGTGSPTREYIYGGSALVATIEGSTTKYHHADHLSMRVTTDSSGNLASQQGHYSFGEAWYAKNGSGGTITPNKQLFTSYERDQGTNESGNDYAMFRTHVSRLGRFNRPDPIAGSILDPQSLNRYAYVRNDPVSKIDPLGLCTWSGGYVDASGQIIHATVCIVTASGEHSVNAAFGGSDLFEVVQPTDSVGGDLISPNGREVLTRVYRTFYPMNPRRITGFRWCGPGGGGPPVNALDAACKAHDECFDRAGLSADDNMGGGTISLSQAVAAQRCNQALFDAAQANPYLLGSSSVQLWLQSGDRWEIYVRVKALVPGTAAAEKERVCPTSRCHVGLQPRP